jgi:drug/metabolite transporter (DMT)-like permease
MSEALPGEAERWRLTERLRKALEKRESPRIQMSVLVVLSGASGFLASVGLLHAGLHRIPVRYVAAVTIAYAVFLALLYVWIRQHRKDDRDGGAAHRGSGSVDLDPVFALDLGDVSTGSSGSTAGLFSGGGGRSGGGGASGSWTGGGGGGSSSGSGGGLDISVDGDDAGVLIALAVAAVILLGASVWLVLAAPSLFAELLLDGALSAGLYRRLKTLPHRPWLETALRRTILPFLLAAVTLGVVGHVMQAYAPEARSLGGVLAHRSASN